MFCFLVGDFEFGLAPFWETLLEMTDLAGELCSASFEPIESLS